MPDDAHGIEAAPPENLPPIEEESTENLPPVENERVDEPLPEPAMPDIQTFKRLGSLPVVATGWEQLGSLIGATKEANKFAAYGINVMESSLKYGGRLAIPVVNKFERPVLYVDSQVVAGIDKLEQRYPIIAKPTPEVTAEAKKVYDSTLRPTVERITPVVKYGVDSVSSVKNISVSTKMMNTQTCQMVHEKVDKLVTATDVYIDHYLPEIPKEAQVKEELNDPLQDEAPKDTFTKACKVSKKATRRVYSHGKAQVDRIVVRSAEAMKKLNFTVDLIEYAKTHLDNGKTAVQDGFVKSKDKMWSVWEEISKPEETESTDSPAKPKKSGLEARLIATARHLTLSVKSSFAALPSVSRFMPAPFRTALSTARGKVDELYKSIAEAKSVRDVPVVAIRSLMSSITSLTSTMLSYSASYLPAWNRPESGPKPKEEVPKDAENTEEKPSDEPESQAAETGKPGEEKEKPSEEPGRPSEEPEKPTTPAETKKPDPTETQDPPEEAMENPPNPSEREEDDDTESQYATPPEQED